MAARSLSWRQVWDRRLARHFLAEPAAAGMADVVGAVCGIHAQVMPSAELSIGLRVAGASRADVRAELWQRRGLVKTYGIRGTVHLFPADELPMWLAALRANRPPAGERPAPAEDDHARTRAVVEAIGEALDGRLLTREELGDEVARRAGSWTGERVFPAFGGMWPRWWPMIGPAAAAGVLCFGPNRGSRVTFVRPDQWIGSWRDVDGREALAEVFRRYLSAYGPATPRDFARWFRMDAGAAAELARSLAGQLEEVDVEGWRGWMLAADLDGPWPAPRGAVRLLPQFDCYVIGCHPRDRLVPTAVLRRLGEDRVGAAWARRVIAAGSVSTIPTLLVDGVVAGVWERRRDRGRMHLRVEPFRQLSARRRRALQVETERVGEILEAAVTLSVGAVDVRPHL